MRIVVAEDSALVREGLVRLLRDAREDVVAAVGDGRSLVDAAVEHRPDLVIVDVRMPPTYTDEGARAAAELRRLIPGLAVLVLSQDIEPSLIELSRGAGGFGYLLKDRVLDIELFLNAARRVALGGARWTRRSWRRSSRPSGTPPRSPSSAIASARPSVSWPRA